MNQFKGLRPNLGGIFLWVMGIATISYMIFHAIQMDKFVSEIGGI